MQYKSHCARNAEVPSNLSSQKKRKLISTADILFGKAHRFRSCWERNRVKEKIQDWCLIFSYNSINIALQIFYISIIYPIIRKLLEKNTGWFIKK